MSSPPEYQSLTQHDPDEGSRADSKVHAYPPNLSAAELGGGGESSTAKPGVTLVNYRFMPRYPVKGDQQDAFGILYPSQEATAECLQRIFPTLAEYDLDRIELFAQMGDDNTWGAIMDDAWPHIISQVPKRIKVQVKDGPGDEKRRTRRELTIFGYVCAGILSAFGVGGLMAYLMSGSS